MTDSKISPEFEAYWNELVGPHFTRAEQFNCPTAEAFTIYQAARQSALEEAAKACEDIGDEYDRCEGGRWPELKSDAKTGAGACEAAIRALASADHVEAGKEKQ